MKLVETKPSQRIVAAITLVALVMTLLVRSQFAEPERIMSARGYGIVAYELAFTAGKANEILTAWGADVEPYVRYSLLVDFAFMPAYALLFAGITLLIARTQSGGLRRAGLLIALLPVAAALLDALENLMLLSMLGSPGSIQPGPPLVAGIAASIKFLLLLVAIVYWLAAAGVFAASLLRKA